MAYPREDNAVDYALQITRNYLDMLRRRGITLDKATILEIGPGADFAVQLVLASHGAVVTLADRFLAQWDDDFHPGFYRDFMARYDGPARAIEAALARGGYDGVLTLLPEPAEALNSIADKSIDLVLSNAVLEHVRDLDETVAELARITRPGGVQAHQVDCRYHGDFSRPLEHLTIPKQLFEARRLNNGCVDGTQLRLAEIAERFTPHFWIDEIDPNAFAEPDYLDRIRPRLQGRYADFPRQTLRITGGRIWLSRKTDPARMSWRRLFR